MDRVPKEGEVFFKVGCKKGRYYNIMRRVVAVVQNWVYYSDGGDKNSACTIDAFQQWMVDAHEVDRDAVNKLYQPKETA